MKEAQEYSPTLTDSALAASKIMRVVAAGAKGGVYGAALEAANQSRELLFGIAFSVLLLPVLFVLMLPSVVFDGVQRPPAGSQPVLNDSTQVSQNILSANADIRSILYASYEDTLAQIDAQRAALKYSDLADSFQGEMTFSAADIIAMYCSCTDYAEINLQDLHDQVAAHQSEFFYYTTSSETRTVSVEHYTQRYVSGETQDIVTCTQEDRDFTVFTVCYRGDVYFQNNVWHLTAEQKETAACYASNLTAYLYDLQNQAAGDILSQISTLTASDTASAPSGSWSNPFGDAGWRSHISSPFGPRADVGIPGRDTTNHKGIDIAYPAGTPVFAVQSGQVILARYSDSYGYYAVISHGGGISTLYVHCSVLLVSAGDAVLRGQTIAEVGATGDATGNHLHLEFILNGVRVNPQDYIE